MFVQIRLLSEALGAVRDGTHIGPLLSVDHKMIEEVVPLSEHL